LQGSSSRRGFFAGPTTQGAAAVSSPSNHSRHQSISAVVVRRPLSRSERSSPTTCFNSSPPPVGFLLGEAGGPSRFRACRAAPCLSFGVHAVRCEVILRTPGEPAYLYCRPSGCFFPCSGEKAQTEPRGPIVADMCAGGILRTVVCCRPVVSAAHGVIKKRPLTEPFGCSVRLTRRDAR
jgi:hypothetical protein